MSDETRVETIELEAIRDVITVAVEYETDEGTQQHHLQLAGVPRKGDQINVVSEGTEVLLCVEQVAWYAHDPDGSDPSIYLYCSYEGVLR